VNLPGHIPNDYVERVLAGDTPRELRMRFGLAERTERRWRAIVRKAYGIESDAERGNGERVIYLDTDEDIDYDLIWQKMIELQKAQASLVRKRHELHVRVDTDRPIGVAFLSDMHIGNTGTDHEQLLKHVDLIARTPGMYCILGGDAVDNFILSKLVSAAQKDMVRPMVQYRLLEDVLRRLDGKVLAVGDGNHTAWTELLADIDEVGRIARKFKVFHTGQFGIVRLYVNDIEYVIYRQHKGRFNSSFNATHTVKQAWRLGPENWDVGIGEHNHVPTIEPFYGHGEKKVAIRTGTYKVYDEYAMRMGFWGVRIGVPVVIFRHDKKLLYVPDFLDDFELCVEYLAFIRSRFQSNR